MDKTKLNLTGVSLMAIACIWRVMITVTTFDSHDGKTYWGYWGGYFIVTAVMPVLFLIALRYKKAGALIAICLGLVVVAFWGLQLWVQEVDAAIGAWIIFTYLIFINGALAYHFSLRQSKKL